MIPSITSKRFMDRLPYPVAVFGMLCLRHLSRFPPFITNPIFYVVSLTVRILKMV